MAIAMVVDDDDDIRMLFREVLHRGGFEVIIAGSVNVAIRLLETQTPDIVFIDMNMPDRPGTDILAYIQAAPRLSGTKTVIVTADMRAETKASTLGADQYLIKPIDISEMLRVAKFLTKSVDQG